MAIALIKKIIDIALIARPTVREIGYGVVFAAGTFSLIMTLAFFNGLRVPSPGPSATGQMALQVDSNAGASVGLPLRWEDHTELVDNNRVPFINALHERVFDLYKRPITTAELQTPKPKLALLVMGLGFDAKATQTIVTALPPEAALAVMPGAPYRDRLWPLVTNERRELWAHVPSENRDINVNEGIDTLRANMRLRGNVTMLHAALNNLKFYAGVALSPGTAVAASKTDMDLIIEELGLRGIGLIIPNTDPALPVMQTAAMAEVPLIPSAINLAQSPLPSDIYAKMDEGLELARSAGEALLVIPEANEKTVATVNEWLTLNKNQYLLVPPSALTN